MKPIQVVLLALSIPACAGSQAPRNLYEVRGVMNQVGVDIEGRARPALEPVSDAVDRNMDRAIGSLGLRGRPAGKYHVR